MRLSRPRWRSVCSVVCFLALAAGPLAAPSAAAPPIEIQRPARLDLTILHDNDIHGHILPFPYTEVGRSKVEEPSRGGAARRATLIHRLRQQIKNPVLLVDSGDVVTRGPFWTTFEGMPDIEALNAIGYDLGALGNNEFKLKDAAEAQDAAGAQSALLQFVKRSRFPWICANAVDEKGEPLQGVQPYVVREIDGVRVGFLGLTAPRSAAYPQTRGWTITDATEAAKVWIPRAREHCDVLVALTHIGTDLDKELAAQTSGIDAIIGGDSHTFLYEPLVVANTEGVKVPIVQDGEFGADLGRFDLHFVRSAEGKWRLASYQDHLIPIGPDLPDDPTIDRVIEPYVHPLETVVGTLPEVGRTAADRERLTTRVLVDAIRQSTGADIALNPQGDGFFEAFRHPNVTLYDVYAVMPFENHVDTATLTGKEIKSLNSAQPASSPNIVSGLPISQLEDARDYRVAVVDFEATSTYKLDRTRLTDSGKDIRDVVVAFLRSSR